MPFLSVPERVSVVVDVGLAQVLGLWILVRLVVVVDGGMAVFFGRESSPCAATPSRDDGSERCERADDHARGRHDAASPLSLHLLGVRFAAVT